MSATKQWDTHLLPSGLQHYALIHKTSQVSQY